MIRLCSILLLAASVTVIAWAQGSGSTRQPSAAGTGRSPDIGTDLPFMVTRILKGKIAEITKDDNGVVVVVEDSTGKLGRLKLDKKTHFKADKKTEYAGKKHISSDDLEIGQNVKITFAAATGQVLEVRLTAKT
jgi:hypothetical protein